MSKICVPAMLNVGSKTVNQASFCMTISSPGTCVSLFTCSLLMFQMRDLYSQKIWAIKFFLCACLPTPIGSE